MTLQTYDVLFPILSSGQTYGQGVTISLDDQDPTTQAMLAEGQIVLASAPNAAQLVSADQADAAAQAKGPGQANTQPGYFD